MRYNVFGVIADVEANMNYDFLKQLDIEYGCFEEKLDSTPADCVFTVHKPGTNIGNGVKTVCGNRLSISEHKVEFVGDFLDHGYFYISDFRPYFTTMIYMILHKRRKFFMFHSSCITYEDEAFMLMGESGAGKSSIAIINLLNGADYFSNDITYVSATDDGVCAYGLPQVLSLDKDALEWFNNNSQEAFNDICSYENNLVFSNKTKTCLSINRKKINGLEAKLKAVIFLEKDFSSSKPWFETINTSCAARKMLEGIRPMDKIHFHPELPLEEFFNDLSSLFGAMDKQVDFFDLHWSKDHKRNLDEFINIVGLNNRR